MAKNILQAIKQLEKTIKTESKKIVEQTAEEIAADARTLAPYDVGATINSYPTQQGATIDVAHPRAAYIEFGTGQKYKEGYRPSDSDDIEMYESYARTFWSGKDWKGAKDVPFLFPVFFRSRDLFVTKLKQAIEDSFK